MSSIISIKNLHYTYPGDEAESLCGVSLEIEKGSFVAVLGHNGSGKSTFIKLLTMLYFPTEGEVLVDGISTADEDRLLDIRRTVGMVFQNPDNQIVANVVEDDVAFAPENLGVTSMNVVVQNIGAAYGALLDEETMVDETIKVLPDQLATASMDVQSCEHVTVEFAGADHDGILTHSTVNGGDVYQLQTYVKVGKYVAVVTLSSPLEDNLDPMLGFFYAV